MHYWFPQYPFYVWGTPRPTAVITSTLAFSEKLKIQQKAKIAKGTITIQMLDKAENTLTIKLILQSSTLAATQSAQDDQVHLPCVWIVSPYHIQQEDWNSDAYWNYQACPKVSNMKTKKHPYPMLVLLIYLSRGKAKKSHIGAFCSAWLPIHKSLNHPFFFLVAILTSAFLRSPLTNSSPFSAQRSFDLWCCAPEVSGLHCMLTVAAGPVLNQKILV